MKNSLEKRNELLTWILGLCFLTLGMDLGGGFYEGFLIVPQWSKLPPQSFQLIQPQNGGISLVSFWIPIHSILTLLFISAVTLAWRLKEVRKYILIAVGTYLAMRLWTFIYFIPEISDFMAMDLTIPTSPKLVERTKMWGLLSHLRTGLVAVSGFFVFTALKLHLSKNASYS